MPLIRRFLLCFIVSMLCLGSFVASAREPELPIQAQAYCLMDSIDRQVLAQSRAHEPLPMASTTKIMTAVVVLERCQLNQTVRVSPLAVGVEGSSAYLQDGEELSVEQLLYALMLESANDAAVALAIHAAGSVEQFVDWMNQTAQAIGMEHSSFKNPHGLSAQGHCACAHDMALLMAHAMKIEIFRHITSQGSYRASMKENGEYRYFSNHNRLLDRYEYCIGGKTGYTLAAGRCLVTSSLKDGVELIAVTLNDRNDWNDHITLYEYGFGLYQQMCIAKAGEVVYQLPVVGGATQSVTVSNQQDFIKHLRENCQIKAVIQLPRFLYAPVTSQKQNPSGYQIPIGRVLYYGNGALLGSLDLYADHNVEAEPPLSFWEKILRFFGWLE